MQYECRKNDKSKKDRISSQDPISKDLFTRFLIYLHVILPKKFYRLINFINLININSQTYSHLKEIFAGASINFDVTIIQKLAMSLKSKFAMFVRYKTD